MTTDYSYWDNVIHMKDETGVLCNAHVGNTENADEKKVNCNKCLKFLEHPKQLETSRKNRKKREEEKKKLQDEEK